MPVIMPQEPNTREGMAFGFIRFVGQQITDPHGDAACVGRELSGEEKDVYEQALNVLSQYFRYPAPEWKTAPSGDGLYLISHLSRASLEAVIINPFGCWDLYDIENRKLIDTASVLWLGPLPIPPTFKKGN